MRQSSDSYHTYIQQRPLLCARFEVISVIGDGAAGVVYRVKDRERAGQEMALKVLTNQIAFDEHTIERFREELRICQEIRHPNIIEAYDLIHRDDTLAFTMEFVDGSDLGKEFKRRTFSNSEIDRIFTQLLSALGALHERGVLHRDIKLENIMLTPEGNVKLSDLGLMKQYEKKMTKTGVLLGTAQYFPPEYVRTGKYDVRAEIFGVGVMLYEFMSGARWLSEFKGAQVITKLLELKFRFPIEKLDAIEEKYRYILQRALQYDARKRFQSASEMRTAFELPSVPSGVINQYQISNISLNDRIGLARAERGYARALNNNSPYLLLIMAAIVGAIMVALLYAAAKTNTANVNNQELGAPMPESLPRVIDNDQSKLIKQEDDQDAKGLKINKQAKIVSNAKQKLDQDIKVKADSSQKNNK